MSNYWEREIQNKVEKLQKTFDDLKEEVKNFKEYEEMMQDIYMEHIVRQDGKRILEKLKKSKG